MAITIFFLLESQADSLKLDKSIVKVISEPVINFDKGYVFPHDLRLKMDIKQLWPDYYPKGWKAVEPQCQEYFNIFQLIGKISRMFG